MRQIGFSSGALAKGDFHEALRMLAPYSLSCLELSALRVSEVAPLIEALELLALEQYRYISFHAPGKFERDEEVWLSNLLFEKIPADWPIVMHPDAIFDYSCWRRFGRRLAVENMDRRKPCGRSVSELERVFVELPEASLCFDIGHARQYDSSMTEAFLMLKFFEDRLVQVHASEVNSESQHDPISYGAKLSFQQVADLIPENIPIIIESRVSEGHILREVESARSALAIGPKRTQPKQIKPILEELASIVSSLASLSVSNKSKV